MDIATSGIIEDLKDAVNDSGTAWASIPEKKAKIARATNLKQELDKLVRVEMFRRPDMLSTSEHVKDETAEETDAKYKIDSSEDNVLTLLADTRPAKQLFSSIRKPRASHQPLGDVVLPNGITTTKIVPKHSIDDNKPNPRPTLKEMFPPPSTLPSLPIPKQSRHTATKSTSVNWYNPAEVESKARPNRRDSYTTQGLSVGQWLTYNVAPSPTQFASPESKRKQRDRALSFGEPQNSMSPETTAAHNQAKEDALFRSVYSSFAPDRDDSNALVAEQQKNRLWWKKYGESKYFDLLAMVNEGDLEQEEANGFMGEDEINEEELQRALKTWRPEEDMQEMDASRHFITEAPENGKEADDLLQEISDLLETLDSHQRVRNLTLTPITNARTGSGQNSELSGMSGSPTTPSSAEFEIYEALKNQLVLIVSTLPPYLLSKLDGDRLTALNISTKIQTESKNQKGTMEEGEVSAAARARIVAPAPVQTPSAYPSVPARSSSYLQATGTPTRQYPGGYAASTAPRPSTNSSYLQNPQYSNRPSNYSSAHARSSYPGQGGYTPQSAASTSASRYNYGAQYGQQSQTSYGSYQNGYRPYAGQNASTYNYNSQYATPQARPSSQASQGYRGSQTDYQHRPVPPQGYGYGSAHGESASPQNQNRSSYSGQAQGSSQRPPLYQQHSSGYQSQPPASPQINGTSVAAGSAAQPRRMSVEEQAAVMERQKAQLVGQQSRQGSGTPQPISGQNEQQNGTPAPQQNGVIA